MKTPYHFIIAILAITASATTLAYAQENTVQNLDVSPHVIIVPWPPQPTTQHITVVIGVNNTIKWVKEGPRDDTITADNNNDPDFAKAAPYFGNHFDGTLVNSTQVGPNETEIFYKDPSGQVRGFFSEPARYAQNILDEKRPFFEYTFTRIGTFGYHGEPWERSSVTVLAPLPNTSAPEFPFAIPILLISITSLIAFYRIRNRK